MKTKKDYVLDGAKASDSLLDLQIRARILQEKIEEIDQKSFLTRWAYKSEKAQLKLKLRGVKILLTKKQRRETPGTTVGKIEMGEDKILDGTIIHRRSKLEEFKTSDTVLPKKKPRKKYVKSGQIDGGDGFIQNYLTPKKRGRPKGKKRGPRLSSKK